MWSPRAADSVCSLPRACGGGLGGGGLGTNLRVCPHPNPPPQAQGNRICVNKTGISLLLDSVRSVNDSYLFTHMRLPCPQGGGEPTEFVAQCCINPTERKRRLDHVVSHCVQRSRICARRGAIQAASCLNPSFSLSGQAGVCRSRASAISERAPGLAGP